MAAPQLEPEVLRVVETTDSSSSPTGLVKQRLGRYHLTPREAEVVGLMATGMCNKEIAARCGIAQQTVKDHLKHVYAKVGAHQRTALLAKLMGLGQHEAASAR